ncbi:MAG: sugar kinase [Amaricoccus sp.]|uniref:tagatose kinase n=1 Tax=Amaricoccus sp. TaxID=1872485 RepID=UPI0039E5A9F4
MKKIITIGEILVEIMATEPGDGFLEPIGLVGPYPSGAPAIFIDQVAKMGQPCGMIACVGADDFGQVNLDRLSRDGVDVSAIVTHPELPTGSAFVRYRPDGSRHFVFNIRHSAAGATGATPEAERLIEGAHHLHVMGSSLSTPAIVALALSAADRIHAKGGTVSFDPNLRPSVLATPGTRETMDEVLARTDLFLPSGPELFLFSSAATEAEAVADLLGRGIGAIVVKDGAEGARYHADGALLSAPAFAVDEIDPTGAGDTFAGTFVALWLRDTPPAQALRIANASGALAVTRRGPMEGTSTMAEIDAFLGAHA